MIPLVSEVNSAGSLLPAVCPHIPARASVSEMLLQAVVASAWTFSIAPSSCLLHSLMLS